MYFGGIAYVKRPFAGLEQVLESLGSLNSPGSHIKQPDRLHFKR